jgi:antagonist of KipI
MIEVLAAGAWTSVQDTGRPGLERYGIPPGGAMDRYSAAVANRLVGNRPETALLELTLEGPRLLFHQEAVIALTGATSSKQQGWAGHTIPSATTIEIGALRPGVRSYLAVRGGINVPLILGSRSLCQRGAFGGGFGRPLQAGDRIAIGAEISADPLPREWPPSHRLPLAGPWEVRVTSGPHAGLFSSSDLERVLNTACRITPAMDRMGIRLETPGLRLQPPEILTTGVIEGAVQVTPSGELIVLMAEHQTTGGYPVIATVIQADLPLLAQARPGDTVHFRQVNRDEAARARRRLSEWLTA